MRLILLTIAIIFSITVNSYSATYYIDYNATDDSGNGTSITSPWKRAPGMVGCADSCSSYSHAAGDVFVFKGGITWPKDVLRMEIANSGENGSPDVYMSGHRCGQAGSVACNDGNQWGATYAIFNGEHVPEAYDSAAGGMVGDKSTPRSYLIFDGIKFVGAGSSEDDSGHAINVMGNNVEIKNCYFSPEGTDTIVSSCMDGGSKLYIHDNYFEESCHSVFISCADNTFDDVRIYNNLTVSGDFNPLCHYDAYILGADSVGSFKATNFKIYNNVIRGSWADGATGQIFINGSTDKYSLQHVYIYNNVLEIENNSGTAINGFIYAYSSTFHVDDIQIYNNTMEARSVQANSCIWFEGWISNVAIYNNIMSGCGNAVSLGETVNMQATLSMGNNLFYNNTRLINDGNQSVMYTTCSGGDYPMPESLRGSYCNISDPKFMSLTDGNNGSADLSLSNISPAIGRGNETIAMSLFTDDILGNPRGTTWDIGAYEYIETSPQTSCFFCNRP